MIITVLVNKPIIYYSDNRNYKIIAVFIGGRETFYMYFKYDFLQIKKMVNSFNVHKCELDLLFGIKSKWERMHYELYNIFIFL